MTTTHRLALIVILLAACDDSNKKAAPDPQTDAGPPACVALADTLATDYSPGADDTWDACISDDGDYHRINDSVSSIARVEAFEDIAELLFTPTADPSAADFLAARMIYQTAEGLDSRVVRRYDPHYAAPLDTDCKVESDVKAEPDYCSGPAKIQPIVLDAFEKGNAAADPRAQAGRIEGALVWFFYISTYKESLSCTDTAEDCDSALAYYKGTPKAGMGIGLGGYVRALDPAIDDAAFQGALALRCWRDLDAADVATDTALRDRAREQYDRAVFAGLLRVIVDRLEQAKDASGAEQAYHWAFVTTLLGALDWAVEQRAPSAKEAIADAKTAATPADTDLAALGDALDALRGCE